MTITCQISVGEFIDKLSILHVKNAQLTDPNRRMHVRKELALLRKHRRLLPRQDVKEWLRMLYRVNHMMWCCNTERKLKLRRQEFDARYLELTIQESQYNDERYGIKRDIDEKFGSDIREQKSYKWV